MKQKYAWSFVAFALIAVLGVSMVSSFGFPGFGNGAQELTDEEKTEMEAQREAMQNAVESGDYATWKALMEEQIEKMRSQITEENFNKILEKHEEMSQVRALQEELKEAISDGDDERAEELRTQIKELMPEGKGFGAHEMRKGRGMKIGQGNCPFAN